MKIRSWFVGANTPGKSLGVALNFGGYPNYIQQVRREAERGYRSYRFSHHPGRGGARRVHVVEGRS